MSIWPTVGSMFVKSQSPRERTSAWPSPSAPASTEDLRVQPSQSGITNDTASRLDQDRDLQLPPVAHLSRYPDPAEEDIDQDPQAHFLSPVQMYESWDDSDDEDGDDVMDWDAGIVDFSLFHDDHKRAKGANLPLPSKWKDLLSDQAKAFQRTVLRTHIDATEPEFLSRTPSGESLPDLTPDSSPHLQDNLDYDLDTEADKLQPRFSLLITPPPTEDCTSAVDDDDDDLPLAFLIERGRAQRRAIEKARAKTLSARPGLRDGRTLSGKRHAWRRPHWDLWPIKETLNGEDESIEREAE